MDLFETLAEATRPLTTKNNTMYNFIVQIKSKSPSIGAKERCAQFTYREDAKAQFDKWVNWLGANINYDHCDLITWFAESEDYTLTLSRTMDKMELIDHDSRN